MKKYAVIGLGQFGRELVVSLSRLGANDLPAGSDRIKEGDVLVLLGSDAAIASYSV
jgi:Trk K+ transport system NAD-binding subunit